MEPAGGRDDMGSYTLTRPSMLGMYYQDNNIGDEAHCKYGVAIMRHEHDMDDVVFGTLARSLWLAWIIMIAELVVASRANMVLHINGHLFHHQQWMRTSALSAMRSRANVAFRFTLQLYHQQCWMRTTYIPSWRC